MKYGVYLSGVDEFSDTNLLADLAQEAEETGWDGVFIWDHIGQPNTTIDPWVALAAMAVKTRHSKLGPVVTPVARRRPWKLARETVTLDLLSNGRLILGVGLGWSDQEFEAFREAGEPRIRAEKLEEGLDILAGLWRGEPFSYHGNHYQVSDLCFLPRPLQNPRILLWVCGAWTTRKAPFRRAAKWDGVVAIADPNQNRAILPEEISAIKAYVAQHRLKNDPFDIVIIMWSQGNRSPQELQEIEKYTRAGATWWLEDLSLERFSSSQEVRTRLQKGPPGI